MKKILKYPLFVSLLLGSAWEVQAGDFPVPFNTEKEAAPPMSAEEAARTAKLPPGFHLEVFAAEPDVQQPISINFDQAGRLWVAECYTYAEQPVRWNDELRDRILILEDTDGDGRADKRTVFTDQLTRLTSVLPGEGGVWALCAPNLLFIPDADGDLVPDGEPVVMLDGFNAENIGHTVVNGLKWGPDGWLYGRHGIMATSVVGTPGSPKDQRVELNCAIWRFHPGTRKFEVFCHGGTNPWGTDWDRNGQLFYTNTVIGHLWHAIPGAYYRRMYGAHLNPHAYEIVTHTADHYHWDTGAEKWSDIRQGVTSSTLELGGGHAHIGCLIYNGGVWPKEYQGKLFTCNLHGRRVNMDILEREGVGYVAHHGKDFLMMEDPWFRALDLVCGPDGQVWMNDWSDTGECHDSDGIHRTSGRIYHIIYDGPEAGKPTVPLPTWLTNRANADFGSEDVAALLNSGDEAKQAMAVRWLSEDRPDDPATLETLLKIAQTYPPGLVRLELAAALQRLPDEDRFLLAGILTQFEGDRDDRQQSLMIWYGVSDAVPEFPGKAIDLAIQSKLPTVTRLISRRLCEDLESNPGVVNSLLSTAEKSGEDIRLAVLGGMAAAFEGLGKAPAPAAWESFSKSLSAHASEETAKTVQSLSVLFGDGRARDELLAIVENEEADAGARRSALSNLARQTDEALLPMLKEWTKDKVVGYQAFQALAAYDDKGIPPLLINQWQRRPGEQSVIIDTLVSRASYASALLDALEAGKIPRHAISPLQARQIANFNDETLSQRLGTLWGEIQVTPEAKLKEIAEWKALLTPETVAAADPAHGKATFSQVCGACHRLYGEGGAIGPELTGSDRHNLDYLLGNIVNPSEVIPADYQLTVFTLKDGRVVSGVVPEQNQKTVTVQAAAEKITLNVDEIANRETLPVSMMPEGLLKALGEDKVKDLVAYLMTSGPLMDSGEGQ